MSVPGDGLVTGCTRSTHEGLLRCQFRCQDGSVGVFLSDEHVSVGTDVYVGCSDQEFYAEILGRKRYRVLELHRSVADFGARPSFTGPDPAPPALLDQAKETAASLGLELEVARVQNDIWLLLSTPRGQLRERVEDHRWRVALERLGLIGD